MYIRCEIVTHSMAMLYLKPGGVKCKYIDLASYSNAVSFIDTK